MDVGREATGEGSSLPGAKSAPVSMDWRGPRGGPWPMSKLTVRPGVGAGAAGRGVPGKAGRVGATGVSLWIVWEAAGDSVSGTLNADALAGAVSLCMGLGTADRALPAMPAPVPAASASPAWPWEGDIRARSCSNHKLACLTLAELAPHLLGDIRIRGLRGNLCSVCRMHGAGCNPTRSTWVVQIQLSAPGQWQANPQEITHSTDDKNAAAWSYPGGVGARSKGRVGGRAHQRPKFRATVKADGVPLYAACSG